jgi:hypothetical protein
MPRRSFNNGPELGNQTFVVPLLLCALMDVGVAVSAEDCVSTAIQAFPDGSLILANVALLGRGALCTSNHVSIGRFSRFSH